MSFESFHNLKVSNVLDVSQRAFVGGKLHQGDVEESTGYLRANDNATAVLPTTTPIVNLAATITLTGKQLMSGKLTFLQATGGTVVYTFDTGTLITAAWVTRLGRAPVCGDSFDVYIHNFSATSTDTLTLRANAANLYPHLGFAGGTEDYIVPASSGVMLTFVSNGNNDWLII